MNENGNDEKYMLSSLSNALDILNELAKVPDMGVTEIASRMGMGKASVFRALYTMEKKGFVKKVGDSHYALGMRLAILGNIANSGADDFEPIHYILEETARQTNVTVYLSMLNENCEVVFMDVAFGTALLQFRAKVGAHYPAYCSGGGKAMLAYLLGTDKEDRLRQINFVRRTATTIGSYKELVAELQEIRKRGYSIDNGEGESELICYGYPVLDRDGSCLCSFSISGPRITMMANQEKFLGILRNGLRELENYPELIKRLINYYDGSAYSSV